MTESAPILEMRKITKKFTGVLALNRVNFQLRQGEVHALVGENGAGKSTLIKVLTGVYEASSGEILFDGRQVSFSNPGDSQNAGISTIYQEVNLIPLLNVAQNIFLGREPRTRFGIIDTRKMNRDAREILKRYDISVDVTRPVNSLGLGVQQIVAIARAVSIHARVVIMDEPTSSLDTPEVTTLFRVIRQLQKDGVGVIYVSHRFDELYEVCEKVTVLRDGLVVHSGKLSDLSQLDLLSAMLGRGLSETKKGSTRFGKKHEIAQEPVLKVRDLTNKPLLHSISFDVFPGEILGLGGLLGSGRTETVEAIFGAQSFESGSVDVKGKHVKRGSPQSAIKAGIAFLSEDRRSEGILPSLSIKENIVSAALPQLSRAGFVSDKAQDKIVSTFIERLKIKASGPEQPVRELSGGNQQKVLLARWLCLQPRLLILDDPTRGIDVGAKAEIQKLIDDLADQGLGIVLISSEPAEVLEGSDRVILLKDGSVLNTLSGDQLNQESMMDMLANKQ